MKKKLYIIYITAFLLICTLPVLLMPFVTDENTENRILAAAPPVLVNNTVNTSFPTQLEEYVSDNFAFRQKLVTLNNIILSRLFLTSGNKKVIVGRENTLFFSETADDYTGMSQLSEREINVIAHNLSLISEYCDKNGIKFVFTVAPNKNSLYPENMPWYYRKANGSSNAARLALKLDGSYYLDLFELFNSREEILYHKRDTHWNNKGALTAAQAIEIRLGRRLSDFGEPSVRFDYKGDLDKMLYPDIRGKDAQYYYDKYSFGYKYLTNFKTTEDIIIKTQNPAGNGALYMFRDSFCNTMLPFLAESYGTACFTRELPYDFTGISGGCAVIEIVERNLPLLAIHAPVLLSPERELSLTPDNRISEDNTASCTVSNGLIKIFGTLTEGMLTDNSVIYIGVNGKLYEAFDVSSNGFAAYIEAEQPPSSVEIFTKDGDCEYTSGRININN